MNVLANTKIYNNYQTVIPKEIRKKYNINKNTIVEWKITDENEIQLQFRQKVTLKDVAGMIGKETDINGDWEIDKGVYLNE